MKSNFNFQLSGYLYLLMCMIVISSCSTEVIESEENNQSKSVKTLDKKFTEDFSKVYNENDCADYCIVPDSGEYYIKRGYKSVNVGPNTKEMSYAAYNTEDSFIIEVTYEITDGNSKANATITLDIEGSILVFEDVVSGTTVSHSIELEEEFQECQQVQYYIRQTALGEPVEFYGSYNLVPVCTGPNVEIGELAPELGGYVFYILQEGDPGYDPKVTHGLVTTTETTGIRIPWVSGDLLQTGATSRAIGSGLANTQTIISVQGEGNYAAKHCEELVYNGFDDWYLPSYDELVLMYEYLYLNNLGDISGPGVHWSSSEISLNGAAGLVFVFGNYYPGSKTNLAFVRAIRSF